MATPTDTTQVNVGGFITESIPKKLHKVINLWILFQMLFRIGTKWYRKYQQHMQYTVTLTGNDDLYSYAQTWLLNQIPSKKRKGIRVETTSRYHDSPVPESNHISDAEIKMWYDGSIEHSVTIDGHRIRVRNETPTINYSGGRISEYSSFEASRNKLLFVAQSTAGRDAVLRLFETLAVEQRKSKRTAALYVSTRWGGMRRMSDLRTRDLSTVALPKDVKENLINDISTFLTSEADYARLGVPWHRGYLFYGEPGGGKTSLATALATEFNKDIYVISLGALDGDEALNSAIGDVGKNAILLLEDIDIVKAARDREDDNKDTITMQMLLNVLDGVFTPHGMITIMTTNRRDALDEAIIRSGRVDKELHVGKLRGSDLYNLFVMLTGNTDWVIYPDTEALPADIVGIAKDHVGNKEAITQALTDWLTLNNHGDK